MIKSKTNFGKFTLKFEKQLKSVLCFKNWRSVLIKLIEA